MELSDGILVIDATWADSTAAALADTIAARSPGKKIRYTIEVTIQETENNIFQVEKAMTI